MAIKKIVRNKSEIFEVVGEAPKDNNFKVNKSYIVGDKAYVFWGVNEDAFTEKKMHLREGFYKDTDALTLITNTNKGYEFDLKTIEEVETERLAATIVLFTTELEKFHAIRKALV